MPARTTITIEDEGYFREAFNFPSNINLKIVLDAYCAHVCAQCSSTILMDFWYETTKASRVSPFPRTAMDTHGTQITDGHTAKALGMQNGDIIDMRVTEQCTRGACPVPPQQRCPNRHYLAEPLPSLSTGQILKLHGQPEAPDRLAVTLKEFNGFEWVVRMRVCTKVKKMMQAYAQQVRKVLRVCRFLVDGVRLVGHETLENVRPG